MLYFGHPESEYGGSHTYVVAKQLAGLGLIHNYKVFSDEETLYRYRDSRGRLADSPTEAAPLLESVRTPFSLTQHMSIWRHTATPAGDGSGEADGAAGATHGKYEYCSVESAWLFGHHCRRFLLHFKPDAADPERNFTVVIIENNLCPYTDTVYKNTRVRFCGTSTVASEKGVSDFNMVVLEDGEPGMLDTAVAPSSVAARVDSVVLPLVYTALYGAPPPVQLTSRDAFVPSSPLLTHANRLLPVLKRAALSASYSPATVEQVLTADRPRRGDAPYGVYHKYEKPWWEKLLWFKRDSTFTLRQLGSGSAAPGCTGPPAGPVGSAGSGGQGSAGAGGSPRRVSEDDYVLLAIFLVLKQQEIERFPRIKERPADWLIRDP